MELFKGNLHKIKSYLSTFVDAEEVELTKYLNYGNNLIFLECHWFFLRHDSFDEQGITRW